VLEQTNQTNVTNGKTTITSQITDLSNKMAQAAFTGGADSRLQARRPTSARCIANSAATAHGLSEGPDRFRTVGDGQPAQDHGDRRPGRPHDGRPTVRPARADAKKWLIDKVYNDPTLNLSLAQRHQAVTTAMGLMEARSAENKALIDANSATTSTTLLTQLHTNQPYNPITVNDAIDNSRRSATRKLLQADLRQGHARLGRDGARAAAAAADGRAEKPRHHAGVRSGDGFLCQAAATRASRRRASSAT
jgi:hypothetical protein